ncbi:MAG: M28 family peptidase [Acidobacteria bacterium]|nr:M28 family peptidase [Acidobacteriota bacterium]
MLRISLIIFIATVAFACTKNAASPVKTPEVASNPTSSNSNKSADFDGERALAHVKAQVEFGPRPAGSAASDKTSAYIMRELGSYGLKPALDVFTATTPRGKVKMKNVIAELPGETSDIIIIASHYDTKYFKEFTFVGANDAGSSTGALLEIARVMAADRAAGKPKRRLTYQFVFFDGEEAFCREWSECLNGQDNTYGSRYMVERLKKEKQLNRIKAMILLDMVGDKDLKIFREDNSSPWLVESIWSTARQLNLARHFPNQTHTITDDHIPFLKEGIPAVDLIDFDYGLEENNYWHTEEDTLDKISAQSLEIVGDVVLESLNRIEAQIR